jgi:pimeloyl-ACP methyl ester carboxylesterase
MKSFHLPGGYVAGPDGSRMRGGMYVEVWEGETRRPYPVVMLHGGGQTGLCFTAKPDGGEGWAQAFARAGFAAYVIDEPCRGRSPVSADLGPLRPVFPAERAEKLFTAGAQWPGSGRRGDPIFDRFYASQTPMLADQTLMEQLTVEAVTALLRQIGPAILLTHSLGGPRRWRVADAVPELVKGILAIEPMGRPFYWTAELATVLGLPADTICHPYGLSIGPLRYEPAIEDPAPLLQWRAPQNLGRWRLANLSGVRVAIVTAEASYHRASDVEIAEFLDAMGVENRLMRLDELGIRGNGHMMMLEKNSDDIALALIEQVSAWGLG